MTMQEYRLPGMTHFNDEDGQINFNASEGSNAIELSTLLGLRPWLWSGKVPIVMDVIGRTNKPIANRTFTNPTHGKFFAPDHDRVMGGAVSSEMPHLINPADGSKFSRLTHYFVKLVGSQLDLNFPKPTLVLQKLGEPRPEDERQNSPLPS